MCWHPRHCPIGAFDTGMASFWGIKGSTEVTVLISSLLEVNLVFSLPVNAHFLSCAWGSVCEPLLYSSLQWWALINKGFCLPVSNEIWRTHSDIMGMGYCKNSAIARRKFRKWFLKLTLQMFIFLEILSRQATLPYKAWECSQKKHFMELHPPKNLGNKHNPATSVTHLSCRKW